MGQVGYTSSALGKRGYQESGMTGGERTLSLNLDAINSGANWEEALATFTSRQNPLMGAQDRQINHPIMWDSFADWAKNNPIVLSQQFQLGFAQSTNPIYPLFPIRFDDRQIIEQNVIKFESQPADNAVRKTGARKIGYTVESRSQKAVFTAQSLSYDYYAQQVGDSDNAQILKLMLENLSANITACASIAVWGRFANVPSGYREPKYLFPGLSAPPMTPEAALSYERETSWGILSRRPQGLRDILIKENAILSQKGYKAARILTTVEDMEFIATRDQTMLSKEFVGSEAVRNAHRTNKQLAYLGDVEIIALPIVGRGEHNVYDDNVFRAQATAGGFFRFIDVWSREIEPENYISYMSDIEACSWQTRAWDTYRWTDAARWDVHFRPLNKDLDPVHGITPASDEGRIDREFLNSIGERLVAAKYYHQLTDTDYAGSKWEFDVLMRHNPDADESGPGGSKLPLYAVACYGELDERLTSTAVLQYAARALLRAVKRQAQMTDEDCKAYEDGLQLMRDLSNMSPRYDFANACTTERRSLSGTTVMSVFKPNRWGGPEFQRDDDNGFHPGYLEGLGTVSGFLTIVHELEKTPEPGRYKKVRGKNPVVVEKIENDTESHRSLAAGQTYEDKDDVIAKVFAFVDVFSRMTNALMTILHDHVALSPKSLPEFNIHDDISPHHAAMIVASQFLVGPVQPPLIRTLSDEIIQFHLSKEFAETSYDYDYSLIDASGDVGVATNNFYEDYDTSIVSTLYGAGPFLARNVPTPAASSQVAEWKKQVEAGKALAIPGSLKITAKAEPDLYPTSNTGTAGDVEYEKITFMKNSITKIESIVGKDRLHRTMVHGLAYPFAGQTFKYRKDATTSEATLQFTDMDRRWMYSHTLDPLLGLAMRALLLTEITLQQNELFYTQDIPPIIFYTIAQPTQQQYMRSLPVLADGQIGELVFNQADFDQIVSWSEGGKFFHVERNIGFIPFIASGDLFHIALNVKGDQLLGGSGVHWTNEGVSRQSADIWKRQVTDRLGYGHRLGNQSNVSIMQSARDASSTRPIPMFDIRGRYFSYDWFTRCVTDGRSDVPQFPRKNQALYPGLAVLNEAFRFPASPAPPASFHEVTFRYLSMQRNRTGACCQMTQRVYSPTATDGGVNKRLIQSYHVWGETGPGWASIAESTNMLRIADNFRGAPRPYF